MAFTYSPFGAAGEPSADGLEHHGDFDEPVTCYHDGFFATEPALASRPRMLMLDGPLGAL